VEYEPTFRRNMSPSAGWISKRRQEATWRRQQNVLSAFKDCTASRNMLIAIRGMNRFRFTDVHGSCQQKIIWKVSQDKELPSTNRGPSYRVAVWHYCSVGFLLLWGVRGFPPSLQFYIASFQILTYFHDHVFSSLASTTVKVSTLLRTIRKHVGSKCPIWHYV
jgi:hypothetical protein